MVWRHVLFPKPSANPLKFEALRALGKLLPSISCIFGDTQKLYSTQFGEGSRRLSLGLTPHNVHSTLANCPSDLVALSFFLWCARQPHYFHDRPAVGRMVNVAGRLVERFESVNEVVRQLECVGCVIKAQTFLVLLRIFWQGGLYSLVFDVFEEMNKFGYTPNTFVYNVIIDVSFKVGRKDVALRVLREISVPNFLSYNIAVCNLCKLNDLDNLRCVLPIMLRSGYYPNADTFVKVLNCLCKRGSLVQAFQLLGLMISMGIQVSVVVWSILIDGFCRMGNPVAAANMLRKMIGVGCSPNIVTYTSLLKTLIEYEMVDHVFETLSLMEKGGCKPDLVHSNMLIHCLSKTGRYDAAMSIFLDLRERNIQPDSYTFSSLISAVQRSGKFFLLPKLVEGVAIAVDIVVCNSLLSYFCKAGLPTHAVNFYHEMVGRGYMPDKYSYAGLLSGICKARKINEALDVYQRMYMSHFNLDVHVHTVVIDGLIKVGKYHQAIRLFEQVVADKCSLDVVIYTVAVEGLVRDGRVVEALTIYKKMKEVGFIPSARTYNLIVSGLCEERDVYMTKELLRKMSNEGIDLEYKTCIKISKLMFESRSYPSIFNLLIKMWYSGLMAPSVMRTLLLEGHSRGIIVGDLYSSLKKHVEISFIDASRSERSAFRKTSTSESDEHSEMVASVG